MSTQFSGRLYLPRKFVNLSEESFFPQRVVVTSASCCMILSPVASSSSKPFAISWRILASGTGVSRAWPVADDCSVSSFRSSSSRSSCAWRLKSSSDGVFSRALLEFERRGWCSCSDSDSSVSEGGAADLFRPLGLRSSQNLAKGLPSGPLFDQCCLKNLKCVCS